LHRHGFDYECAIKWENMMIYSAQTVENRSPSLLMGGVEPNDRQFRRAGHQLHCLVVDDNEYVLKFVAYLLTKIGFLKVDTAQKNLS
jgi:hypothetical protein